MCQSLWRLIKINYRREFFMWNFHLLMYYIDLLLKLTIFFPRPQVLLDPWIEQLEIQPWSHHHDNMNTRNSGGNRSLHSSIVNDSKVQMTSDLSCSLTGLTTDRLTDFCRLTMMDVDFKEIFQHQSVTKLLQPDCIH